MILYRPAGLIVACLLLAACAAPAAARPPELRVVAANPGDTVAADISGEDLLIDVQSPRGVGAATVELVGGALPATVRVRLHLAALEEFRLAYGQAEIIAGVSQGPGREVSQRLVDPNSGEQPLAPDSPYWMPVSLGPAGPAGPGPITVTLPADLGRGGHRSFSIRWVDLYR